MTKKFEEGKLERAAQLRWVPISKMRVSPEAQRDHLNQGRVDSIAANFNPEFIGTFVVNERDGVFWVIDGQHREAALEQLGMGDYQVQCWTYVDLTDEEMADLFLGMNDALAVDSFTKFRVGVNAGRATETRINDIVRSLDLIVTRNQVPGAVSAVGALRAVHASSGASTLKRVLVTIRDSWGDVGFRAEVIRGLGLFFDRYPEADDSRLMMKMKRVHGGVSGLMGRASELKLRTGKYKSHCIAAALVEIYNRGRGGRNLPLWWK